VEDSTVLVLSRKIGETISVGDGIEIVVNRISGNRVTLGIKAPGSVRIVRGELEPLPHGEDETTFEWSAAETEMVAH
jgi:carbon storage regulator CsrA